MGFKENLLRKIQIKRLTAQVQRTIAPPDSPQRIDRQAMKALLEMGDYVYRRERDLDLYCQNDSDEIQMILVLDNELKLYRTSVADVALRKSPTVKEMVSIRNAIKILNDKDVVVSRKGETLKRVENALIEALDLSYTAVDIDRLVQDGRSALENKYAEGVVETATLFADLLGYQSAPKAFQLHHHHIWGAANKPRTGEIQLGPSVIFSLMDNRLIMLLNTVSNLDKAAMQNFQQITAEDAKAEIEGAAVFESLGQLVLKKIPGKQSKQSESLAD